MLKHGIPLLLFASGVMFFAAGFLAPLTGNNDASRPRIAEPNLPQIASLPMRGGGMHGGHSGAIDDAHENHSGTGAQPEHIKKENKTVEGRPAEHGPVPVEHDNTDGGGDHGDGEHGAPVHAGGHGEGHDDVKDGHAPDSGDEDTHHAETSRRLTIGQLPAGDDQPWRIVRDLQLLQDDIAQGRQGAIEQYRAAIVAAGQVMSGLAAEKWNIQRNLDAAAIYLLIGGNPAVGDIALSKTGLGEDDRLPLEAARAFTRTQLREAEALFKRLGPDSLPPSARGQFALARSIIHAGFDVERAGQLLEEARRQAPGTLIEEAALRRLLRVAGEAEDVDTFGYLARTYQDRFRNSGYFGDFVRNFAVSLSTMPSADQHQLVGLLENLCDTLHASEQLPVVGSIAKRATVDGKTILAQWAATRGLALLDETSKFRAQFNLYLGAAQVVEPDKTAKAIAMLEGIDRDDLDRPNRLLLDAVLELSRRITGEPVDLKMAKALLGREQQVFPGDDPVMPVSEGELREEVSAHRAVMRMNQLARKLEANGLEY